MADACSCQQYSRENATGCSLLYLCYHAMADITSKITQIHHSGVYQPHLTAQSVLEDLLSHTWIDFAREFPQGAELNWYETIQYFTEIISHIRGMIPGRQYRCMAMKALQNTTASKATIEQFANNVALVCSKNPAHRQIEVCFVYKAEVIVSLIIF